MRKLILVLNILVMMVCAVWGQDGVWNGEVAGTLEPTSENPNVYHISTAAQLAKLADLVNKGNNFVGKTVILQNDIVLNVGVLDEDEQLNKGPFIEWTPIGKDEEKPFKGTFDGNNKTVSGVYVYIDAGNDKAYLGLFGCLGEYGNQYGEIKNVGVEDSYVKGTGRYAYVGGVCGYSYGSISNSYNAGSVTGDTGEGDVPSASVGGVCGYSYGGTISNCYNIGSVTGEDTKMNGKGYAFVGGVCGSSYNYSSISNCYNAGSVTGQAKTQAYVGGVCGFSESGMISNCYNAGSVTGEAESLVYLGGVCGINEGEITGCYYLDVDGAPDKGIGNKDDDEAKTCPAEPGAFAEAVNDGLVRNPETPWIGEATVVDDQINFPILARAPEQGQDGIWLISSTEDLSWFAEKVNSGCAELNGKLMEDIAVSEYTLGDTAPAKEDHWTPIGNYDYPFKGTFDGNGKTVSGVYIDDATSNANLGLFGYLGQDGKIENVGVVDSYVKGTGKETSVGGVCGLSSGSIEDSYNAGLVEGGEYAFIGGVCGYSVGSILNSYNAGSVKRGEGIDVETEFPKVGGVCGYSAGSILNSYNAGSVGGVGSVISVGGVCGDSFGSILNSYNAGSVEGTGEYVFVGGVCGNNSNDGFGSSGSISNSYNVGSVKGIGEYADVGGVCGFSGGSIANSYNTTSVTGGDGASVGGVCGSSGGSIANSYNTGSVTGGDGASVGGVCGYNHEEDKITDCYYLTGTATNGIEDGTDSGNEKAAPKTAKELADEMAEKLVGAPWTVFAGYTSGTLTLPAFSEDSQIEIHLAVVDEAALASVIDFVNEKVQESTDYEVATDLSFEAQTIVENEIILDKTYTTIYVRHKDGKEGDKISDVIALSRPATLTEFSEDEEKTTATSITLKATTDIEGRVIEYGKANADGPPTITWQSSPTFGDLTPETKYIFYARIQATESSFASLSSEVDVTTKKGCEITINAGITNGTVKTDKTIASEGEIVTLTVSPAEGYELTSLKANNDEVSEMAGDNKYTFKMPEKAVTITAVFTIKTYIVTVSCDIERGTVTGSDTYEHGATATLTATATSGYHFTQWSSGETANPLTITVTGNLSLTASFEKDQVPEPEPTPDPDPVYYYTVTIPESITGAIIHGGGTHQVREGSYIDFSIEIDPAGTGEYPTVTVDGYWWNTLRPDTRGNYRVYVYDDDCDIRIGEVSGYGTYTLTLPADSLFEGDDLYRSGVGIAVTSASSSPSSDALRYPFGTELTLTAVSDTHRTFVEWMDGSRRSPLTFRLREDTEAYAWFRALHPVGNEEIAVAGIRIRTERGGSIVIDTPKRLPIAIYALSGQCLRRSESEGTTRFSGLSEGSYLVVVGTHSEVVIVR